MKLALRLQRGEAFGPGGPISKFVLAVVIRSGWGLGWAALSKNNLHTRQKKRNPISILKLEIANPIETSTEAAS